MHQFINVSLCIIIKYWKYETKKVTQHTGLIQLNSASHPAAISLLLCLFTSFYHRVQSAQQFQALQAQYSGVNPNHQFHHPEGHAAMAHMAHPEAMMDQQEPANLAKRTAIPFD